jgi:aromatic-L-amino-acid decarboxylase
MIGLPGGFTGVIQDTASTATLVAMLGARERATGGDFGRMGAAAPGAGRLRVYTSTQAHSSVMKAARLAGFGTESVRAIEVDAAYAMEPGALRLAIEADVEAGERPACVVATVGTTSSTALDPLPQIAAICADHDIWLHVDAAYAGSAAILDERRWILDGIEGADSLVFNPHKWLMTNFDCSAYYVRDVEALLGTFATDPEYLRTARDSEVRNYRDWGVQLGRRFRALKLWFVIRSYGVDGLREILRAHIEWGERFARWVDEHEDFERLAPAPLGLVCFRCRPSSGSLDESELDALNLRLLEAINADGRVFLTHTRLDGRYTLRLAVGQRTTRLEDVELAWRLARREARRLLAQ